MPGLLHTVPTTDAERRAHDRHRPLVVLAVLAVLCAHAYLFSNLSARWHIPRPAEVAESLSLPLNHVFDEDRLVNFEESIMLDRFEPLPEASPAEWRSFYNSWRHFYYVLIAAFLCAYLLPLPLKQPSLVFWSVVAIALMYDVRAVAGLLAAHLVVYQTLHPTRSLLTPAMTGLCAAVALRPGGAGWGSAVLLVGVPLAWTAIYRGGVSRLLAIEPAANVARNLVVQSAILTVGVGALVNRFLGEPAAGEGAWVLPLGVLLFFWNWARVIMYHIDYKDGQVPRDLPVLDYLAIFFTPGAIPYWDWGGQTGQGYAYTSDNFLCEDKNKTVLAGARILLLAMVYLFFWDEGRHLMVAGFTALGIEIYNADTAQMVAHFTAGGEVSTASVLATTFVDIFRWLLVFGGLVHFKVGLWRICGYRVDPYFDRPWMSTNLVTFWSRFTFHYREFLVRAFYYPVFFRFFKKHRSLRIVAATMAAATFGNLVWGHATEALYDGGMRLGNLAEIFRAWPYFVLLGLGISVTELYLVRRKKARKPWTPGPRIVLDVLAAYATWQYYSMIHIFRWPAPESTLGDLCRLFLRGFGIHL